MSHQEEIVTADALYQNGGSVSTLSNLQRFGTYLAFRGHGVRVGLELSACILLYSVLSAFLPLPIEGMSIDAQTLFSWFASCFTIALFDQLVLLRPLRRFRAACELELQGRYDEALKLLETISPTSKSIVTVPKPLYHLRRSLIYTHAERFANAAHELAQAQNCGLNALEYYVGRSELFRYRKEFEAAQGELQMAEYVVGNNPVLCLEEALLRMEQRDMRGARNALDRVLALPCAAHPNGESTYALGRAYLEATRLWTGEAEEGLVGLTEAITNLRMAADYIEALRPTVASLLCERAYYLVTHKEPVAAEFDAQVALKLCRYPHIQKRTAEVEEEKSWRFPK